MEYIYLDEIWKPECHKKQTARTILGVLAFSEYENGLTIEALTAGVRKEHKVGITEKLLPIYQRLNEHGFIKISDGLEKVEITQKGTDYVKQNRETERAMPDIEKSIIEEDELYRRAEEAQEENLENNYHTKELAESLDNKIIKRGLKFSGAKKNAIEALKKLAEYHEFKYTTGTLMQDIVNESILHSPFTIKLLDDIFESLAECDYIKKNKIGAEYTDSFISITDEGRKYLSQYQRTEQELKSLEPDIP